MEQWKKELLKISQSGRWYIIVVIEKILAQNFSDLDIKKLKNTPAYRCRYWSYRIIFTIKWGRVFILKIWTRGNIYKNI